MEWDETQQARFDRITDRDVAVLLRQSSTDYNFSDLRPKVERIIDSIGVLKESKDFWELLPQNYKDQINEKLDQIANIFDEIQNFDTKRDNVWAEFNNLKGKLESEYEQLYSILLQRLDSYQGQRAYTKELSSGFGKEAKENLTEIRKARREIDKIRRSVQEAETIAGEVASTETARFFDEEAESHEHAAGRWFRGIIAFSILGVVVALTVSYQVYKEINGNRTIYDSTEAAIFKIAIVALVYFALKFMFRNYGANKHQQVTNKHRANVLKAMEAFRNSATDETTKNSVLLAAVASAYSQVDSGFITTKEGAGVDEDNIMDIVNLASNRK